MVIHWLIMGIGRIGEIYTRSVLPNEQFVLRNFMCIGWRTLHETGMPFTAFVFLIIAIERTVATVAIKTYEKKDRRIGVALVVVVYTLSVAISLSLTVHDTVLSNTFDVFSSTESCQMSSIHPQLFLFAWLACLPGFLLAIALLVGLYVYNRRKQRIVNPVGLSGRYQYVENVGTLRVIVPAMLAYGVLGIIGWSFFPRLIIAWQEGDTVEYNLVLQILYFIPALGAFATPFAFFITYPPLKAALFEDVRRLLRKRPGPEKYATRKIYSHTPEEEAKVYFRQLDASWK